MDDYLAALNMQTEYDVILNKALAFLASIEIPNMSDEEVVKAVWSMTDPKNATPQAVNRLRSGEDKFTFFEKALNMMEKAKPYGELDKSIAKLDDLLVMLKGAKKTSNDPRCGIICGDAIDTMQKNLTQCVELNGDAFVEASHLLPKVLEYLDDVKDRLSKISK